MTDLTADRALLRRTCDRLRSLSDARLTRTGTDGGRSVAEIVHETCRWAAAAQGLPHPVPRLHPFASGDELAVIGSEFLDWAAADGSGRRDELLEEWRARVQALRRFL